MLWIFAVVVTVRLHCFIIKYVQILVSPARCGAQNDPISVIRKPAEVLFVFSTHKYSGRSGELVWTWSDAITVNCPQNNNTKTSSKSSLADYWMLDNLIRFIFSPFVSSQCLGRCERQVPARRSF